MTTEIAPEVPAAAVEPTPEKGAVKRVSPATWIEIREHLEYGTMTVAQICDKYEIKPSTVRKHIERLREAGDPIVFNSKKHLVKKKVEETIAGAVTEAASTSFASQRRQNVESLQKTAKVLGNAINSEMINIIKGIREGKSTWEAEAAKIKTIRSAGRIIQENHVWLKDEVFEAHKDIDQEELPQLIIRDLSDEEISAIQQSSGEDDDPMEGLEALEAEEEDVVEEV